MEIVNGRKFVDYVCYSQRFQSSTINAATPPLFNMEIGFSPKYDHYLAGFVVSAVQTLDSRYIPCSLWVQQPGGVKPQYSDVILPKDINSTGSLPGGTVNPNNACQELILDCSQPCPDWLFNYANLGSTMFIQVATKDPIPAVSGTTTVLFAVHLRFARYEK